MRTWSQIRPQADKELADVKDALLTAHVDDVPALQIRAAVLARLIAWFEEGAPSERRISEDSPVNY